jgi:PAS domain S-box-containing protein
MNIAASSGLPDVGELRRQLADVSERFELTSLAAPDILYDWAVGGELRWGGAIHARLGYRPEDIENSLEWWKGLVHPDDLARTMTSLEEALAGSSDRWSGTYRLRKSDSTYASVIERAIILRDDAGRAVRLVGSIVDLTEQAQLGEQLTQSESRYEAVFANSLDAIIVTTTEGALLDMNPAAQLLFGVNPKVVRNFRASDAYVNASDRDELRRLMVSAGYVRGYQMRLRRADGSTFLATYNGSLWRDGSGAVLGFVGVIRDITERSRMEEALRAREALFRAIVENGNEVVGLIDATGRIAYITPSVRTMGATPEQVVGQQVSVFVHPDDHERFQAAFDRAVANPETVQALAPYRAINPAGRMLWVEARFTNQLGNPAIAAIVIHARDVSERSRSTPTARGCGR